LAEFYVSWCVALHQCSDIRTINSCFYLTARVLLLLLLLLLAFVLHPAQLRKFHPLRS